MAFGARPGPMDFPLMLKARKNVMRLKEATFPKIYKESFFQNGFAKFNVGSDIMIHPFDGDGMVSAVTIKDGKPWYRNQRYVQTRRLSISQGITKWKDSLSQRVWHDTQPRQVVAQYL
jgi:carotenoid cleavage dioxygenase-like enzyme